MAEAKTSIKRIKSLLMEPELEGQVDGCGDKTAVSLKNVVVNLNENETIFKGINLEVQRGLTAIAGPLGSGKSTLLKTILKDVEIIKGEVSVSRFLLVIFLLFSIQQINGSVAYVSQDPWLFPGTIRQNILFGTPFNAAKYQKVIQLCALSSDLENLPKRDNTVVIDKGLNLSKGQQARINLARAIYKDSDIILLDDCLSSLDTNVSRYIFNNCIRQHLQDKLCLLVTHQQQYLKACDNIVYLKEGQIQAQGSYQDLLEAKFDEMLQNQIDYQHVKADLPESEEETNENVYDESSKLLRKDRAYYEEKKEGRVDWKCYKTYIKSGGPIVYVPVLLGLFVCAQFSGTSFDYLVSRW